MSKITTFFMFEGKAEEALNFYISLFDNSKIIEILRYGANEDGIEGTVKQASFLLCGQPLMCIDSSVKHGFSFTPSISLYVTCDTEREIERVFDALAQEGTVHMPLAAYPFSQKFGWVADQFGVSWQLNLADDAVGKHTS
ncbi:VOC family protein [Alicyclobacillus fodiniaquatilis]|uniref:VOC family protein n=1 Tax=Alicyclobacillus fodiniaquatilis TaxID=1661150 RepID=A0ABW4JJT5_9BACL